MRSWVQNGGSLFLIADHMPFPGAAENLAAAFRVRLNNGFVLREGAPAPEDLLFQRSTELQLLADHPITNGRSADERVSRVMTFMGSAFQVDPGAQALLAFGPGFVSVMPTVAWEFPPGTPRVSVSGWSQGAALEFGKGRVALFGEAAMFSAQLTGRARLPMGMNSPGAEQNAQFLLNVAHWLSGLLDEPAPVLAARGVVSAASFGSPEV